MNKLQKFISRIRGKAASVISLTANRFVGGYTYFIKGLAYAYNDRNFAEYLYNGYGRNPYVYAVVDKIADISSSLPRCFFDKEGGKIETRGVGMLGFEGQIRNPNSQDSGDELYYKIITSLLVTGNAILFAERGEGGEFLLGPGEVRAANINDVQIKTSKGGYKGIPQSYTIQDYGTYLPEDILHIRFPNPLRESVWGLSPLHSGQAVYTASNDLFEAKAHLFKNRGVSGILSAKDTNMPIMPAEQERLQKDWDGRTAGSEKFGGMYVTTAAMNYLDIGMSSKDLELAQHNIENLRDVCRIYGVDSSLFGDPQNRTYSNQEQAVQALYRDVILPLCYKVDQKLSEWLLNEEYKVKDAYWKIDTESIAVLNKPDQELSSKVIAEVNAGILSPEQALEMLYPELGYQGERETEPV